MKTGLTNTCCPVKVLELPPPFFSSFLQHSYLFLILFVASVFYNSLAVRSYWSCFVCLDTLEHSAALLLLSLQQHVLGGEERCWALINLVRYIRWLLKILWVNLIFIMKGVIHSHLLFLLHLKKSKRSAYESAEEHSAKYSNSNNSGNYREKSLLLHSCVSVFVVAIVFWLKRPGVTISLHHNIELPNADRTVSGVQ